MRGWWGKGPGGRKGYELNASREGIRGRQSGTRLGQVRGQSTLQPVHDAHLLPLPASPGSPNPHPAPLLPHPDYPVPLPYPPLPPCLALVAGGRGGREVRQGRKISGGNILFRVRNAYFGFAQSRARFSFFFCYSRVIGTPFFRSIGCAVKT